MLLFLILLIILAILVVVTVVTIGMVGAGAILIFGDVFVCIFIIILIMRFIIKRRRK